jgi:hypothetical protein
MSTAENTAEVLPVTRANYKTKICKYGKSCQYGDRCFYAHSEKEILPRNSSESLNACRSGDGQRNTPQRRILSRHPARFIGESPDGTSDRLSVSPEKQPLVSGFVSINCPTEPYIPIPIVCSLSVGSKSETGASQSGSTTPVSGDQTIDPRTHPLECIRFLQMMYSPKELETLLVTAAPPFYTE